MNTCPTSSPALARESLEALNSLKVFRTRGWRRQTKASDVTGGRCLPQTRWTSPSTSVCLTHTCVCAWTDRCSLWLQTPAASCCPNTCPWTSRCCRHFYTNWGNRTSGSVHGKSSNVRISTPHRNPTHLWTGRLVTFICLMKTQYETIII